MAQMKALATVMREKRATAVVLQPMQRPRFYKSRTVALAVAALQRAAGRIAHVFPDD